MKSFFASLVAIAFILGSSWGSSWAHGADLAPGFYFYQGKKVVSVYSDLINGTHGQSSGSFAVDATDQVPLSRNLSDYQFLGSTQTEAAIHLNLDPSTFSNTVYLAHRGTAQIPVLDSSSLYPGNTLAAMDLALQNGYQGFEFDVQMTQDQQFVVSHDENLGVSTSCSGNVSDTLLTDLANCKVLFTGLIPEQTLLHSPASIPQMMPSLKNVFDRYLSDPRVLHLVVDTKTGDIDTQVAAFDLLLSALPESAQAKIIFLVRDLAIETKLQALGKTAPLYALEGNNGWEPLQGPVDPNAHAISLSLGIGLGIGAGQGNGGMWDLLMSLPSFFIQGTLHGWAGGSVDLASIQWLPATMDHYKTIEAGFESSHMPVIAWTINTGVKISWLRTQTPHLPVVLSDLPHAEIEKIEVKELQTALTPASDRP